MSKKLSLFNKRKGVVSGRSLFVYLFVCLFVCLSDCRHALIGWQQSRDFALSFT